MKEETKERKLFKLTSQQKSILSIEEFYPNTNINSIGGYCYILEEVDFDLFIKAFNLTVQKNDALRIRLTTSNNETMQYIDDYKEIKYSVIDIKRSEFEEKLKNIVPPSFNIFDSQLFTVEFYRFEDGQGAYVSFLHHLISDAWTMSIYVNDTMNIYHALKNGLSVDEITYPSYLDYIESEQKYFASERYQNDKEFWDNQFKDSYCFTSLKSTNSALSTEFVRKTTKLPSELLSLINDLCKIKEISVPSFLLSAYTLYFSRLKALENFTLGTPVLNRSNFAEKNTLGAFISTMPIIINYNENESFIERTENILRNQKIMFRHLKFPYNEVAKIVKNATGSSEKLYDVVFSYQNARSDTKRIDIPFEMKWLPSNNQLESLMIHITDTNDSGILSINYDYQTSVFSESDINTMHERVERIMYQALSNQEILCKDIEIVTLKEKNELLRDFNDTESTYSKNSTIIQEFEKGVRMHPNTIAVSFKEKSLTYLELNNCANQLATKLIELGIKPDDIVGILLPRSVDIIISIMAILKAGATYMPIEPEYPKQRVDFMVENSCAKIIITNETLKNTLSEKVKTFVIDDIDLDKSKKTDNLNLEYNPESLSYIMYTSGTTGIPKAVMIRNYSVLNFAESMRKRLDYTSSSDNKVLSVTTMCFDIFVFEVFPTLIWGLHLVIANEEEQKSPVLLSKLIEEEKICKLLTTPSRVQLLFLDSKYLNCLKTLKEIILGGEPFPVSFLHELPKLTSARIFNLYGPTETTVYSTFKELTDAKKITIGKPIENTTIYVLDSNKKLLPIGCHGELYIGGSGVAKGYYKNEALTNEKFINNPYNKDEIIYNTGDLATWLPNGELLCFGRTDNQVKIRGYRIELGDIESHIANYPGITKAVVILKSSNDSKQYLCAYFTADKDIKYNDLHKYLVSCLPNYMVPSCYMKLDAFPLTPNHKVDKKSLPEPESFISNNDNYVSPTTETEKTICKVMEEVLKVDKIGIEDDIFDYAIDSLSIIQIQTLLIPYNMKFKTQDFYSLRTIKELSKQIDNEFKPTAIEEPELFEFNKLVKQNTGSVDKIEFKEKEKGYLLSGITGYLGIHILNELLETTSEDIYCTIRKKNDIEAKERLKIQWEYYFKDKPIDYSRIHVVDCDIVKDNFELSDKELESISSKISAVINCAANVKYYGEYSKHELINVHGVKNMIDFCLKYDKHLYHISTMGVSGNYLVSQSSPNALFTENDFYIGQNYKENVYIHSKFEAEKEILKAKEKGLKYNIFRIGNLTARYSDGVFQQNKDENAFYNIIKFVASNGIIPKDMMDQSLEFTPVDLCAKAIIKLVKIKNIDNYTFHLYNEHSLSLKSFVQMLRDSGTEVEILPSDVFNTQLVSISEDTKIQDSLKAVVNDLDKKHGLSFMPSVTPSNKITNKYLEKLDFKWPEITIEYIRETLKTIDS